MDGLFDAVGRTELRNPMIAGPADHFIDEEGVRRAIKTGVGAVVLKSVNETQNAKDQLQSAEYVALDEHWRPVAVGTGCAALDHHREPHRARARIV